MVPTSHRNTTLVPINQSLVTMAITTTTTTKLNITMATVVMDTITEPVAVVGGYQ